MRFLRNQDGGVMVYFAFILPILLGVGALAIDLSYLYFMKGRLQNTADAASFAGALDLPDQDAAKLSALQLTEDNMRASVHGMVLANSDILFGNWSDASVFTADDTPINAIQVTTRRSDDNGNAVGLFLARTMGINTANVIAVSVSALDTSPVCMLSLDPSAADAIMLDSNATITTNDCSVYANSNHRRGINVRANAYLEADNICVNGDYSGREQDFSQSPSTGCGVLEDPLADLAPPTFSGCDYTNEVFDNRTTTIPNYGDPVVFCGGLNINNNSEVDFEPGIYVIDGGPFEIDSNAIVNAEGVTFYFTNDGYIDFRSNTEVTFSAPIDGDTAGIIFFQDRDDNSIHTFNSNTVGNLEGTIYLPGGTLHLDSNSEFGLNAFYTIVIANMFDLDSNAALTINSDIDASDIPLPDNLDVFTRPKIVM